MPVRRWLAKGSRPGSDRVSRLRDSVAPVALASGAASSSAAASRVPEEQRLAADAVKPVSVCSVVLVAAAPAALGARVQVHEGCHVNAARALDIVPVAAHEQADDECLGDDAPRQRSRLELLVGSTQTITGGVHELSGVRSGATRDRRW